MEILEQIKELEININSWKRFNLNNCFDKDIEEAQNKIEELKSKLENNDTVWKIPFNTSKENMQNKKCDYKILAIMTLYSNKQTTEQREEGTEEEYRFLYYDKVIRFTDEIENLSKNKINTILKNMKKLSNLDGNLVTVTRTNEGKIVYYINYTKNGREFEIIEEDILRKLINATNSNTIKTYLFLKYICKNSVKMITRDFIAQNIGLSINADRNLKIIKDITETLEDMDLINIRREHKNVDGVVRDYRYYSVVPYEEYKQRRKEKENRN